MQSKIAEELHRAAMIQDEEARKAWAEYEALLVRVYGADEAAKEVRTELG